MSNTVEAPCSWEKTAIMVVPCELARLPGRIKNRSWGWKDVAACECYRRGPYRHILPLCGALCIVAALTMNPVLIAAAGIITVVKIKNYIRSKL